MSRYSPRTLVTQPSTVTWGLPALAGGSYGVATGGSSSSITVGGVAYTLLTFTATSTLTVTRQGLFDVLIVGGGGGGRTETGGGSAQSGGGGGAGGIYIGTAFFSANMTVTVGAGGAGFADGTLSRIGSSADDLTANGGTTGISQNSLGGTTGRGFFLYQQQAGGNIAGGAGGGGFGGAGYSGGGSGIGAKGGDGSASLGGAGGAGLDISTFITGASYTIGGGGGGGSANGTGGAGGTGGGGAGGGAATNGSNATLYGAGGGGPGAPAGGTRTGGNGSGGIVYVRFKA